MDDGNLDPYTRIILRWGNGRHRTAVETVQKLREVSLRVRELIKGMEENDRRREAPINSAS